MSKFFLILLGILLGWFTFPIVQADTNIDQIRSYMGALKKILTTVEHIERTSQETADNTAAIRKKLGA